MTTSPESITHDLLTKGVAEVIDEGSLTKKLRRRKPLRVKLGIDPTGYHLHLGHVVPLRKLRAWQEAGHIAVLIIGDYTARIGDPSGRDKARTALSAEQVKKFAGTYLDQVGKILDMRKAEIHYNSEWFERFTVADLLKLLGHATVNQMLAHETFRNRVDSGQPLGIHELAYPLLQGYDSVMVNADLELGGMDQKFNLLAGRDMQQANNQLPQDVMMMDYLIGTDGKMKMSKTADNFIALEDSAGQMYGKVMSLPDKLIPHYLELATDVSTEELQEIKKMLRKKETNPRDIKKSLARRIAALYHGDQAAADSESEFTQVFSKKGLPTDMPTASIRAGEHPLLNLLVSHQLAESRSAARRLIEQGGVKVDNKIITDWTAVIEPKDGTVLQVGKRKFLKLSVSQA